jgi:hypothetical protein
VNLTTDTHLVPIVGISTAKLPFPHMPSNHTETHFWLELFSGDRNFQKHLRIVHTKSERKNVAYIQGVTGGTDQTSGGCSLC